jgi:predicted MFS family arabinose efflux permease
MNADIIVLLVLNAIVCAIYYGFIASLSTLFTAAYPFLNSTKIGLCYLGIGGGMTIGSWANGRYLDWEFRRLSERAQLLEEKGSEDLDSFPFEKVRWAGVSCNCL